MSYTSRGINEQLVATKVPRDDGRDRERAATLRMIRKHVYGETLRDEFRRIMCDQFFGAVIQPPGMSREDRGLLYWWGAP